MVFSLDAAPILPVAGATFGLAHANRRAAFARAGSELSVKIDGSLLVRNTGLSFIALVLPLPIAILTVPFLIRGLGTERFGLLSLAWSLIGYFNLFDLGLGRATTKFVSEALGKDQLERIPHIIWTSLVVQLAIGLFGAVVLATCTPLLVSRFLKISPNVLVEGKQTFYLLSLATPLVISSRNLRGVLEASQRFDLIACVQIPASLLNVSLHAIGGLLRLRLPQIIGMIICLWVINATAYLFLCFRLFPALRRSISPQRDLIRPLFSFGGWIALCNLLVPLLVSFDRFAVGALLSVSVVAYYTVPYDMVFRLLIIPSVIATTLFPAFSTLHARSHESLERYYLRSLKYILLVMVPLVVVGIVFAPEILRLWLGKEFMIRSTAVFQILAVGMLLNGLSQMPANLLDGIGRPDLRAKVFLAYIPVYMILLWLLITRLGLVGAALAWTLRSAMELIIFASVASRLLRVRVTALIQQGFFRAMFACGALLASLSLVRVIYNLGIWHQSFVTATCLTLFALIVWRFVLDTVDRQSLSGALRKKAFDL